MVNGVNTDSQPEPLISQVGGFQGGQRMII